MQQPLLKKGPEIGLNLRSIPLLRHVSVMVYTPPETTPLLNYSVRGLTEHT